MRDARLHTRGIIHLEGCDWLEILLVMEKKNSLFTPVPAFPLLFKYLCLELISPADFPFLWAFVNFIPTEGQPVKSD
jgi:hypothetical protein